MRAPLGLAAGVVLLAGPAFGQGAVPPIGGLSDCDALVAKRPDALDPYRCFARIAHYDGSFDAARQHLERFIQQDRKNHRALLALARLESDQRGDGALTHAEQGADLAHAAGDNAAEVEGRTFLAGRLGRRQKLDDANRELQKAEAVANSAALKATVEVGRAYVAGLQHDYARATILLKDSEPLLFPNGPVDVRIRWLAAMGSTAWYTGRFDESLRTYTRQAELLAQIGDRYEESTVRLNLVLLSGGRNWPLERRLAMAKSALALATASGNVEEEGTAYFYLASLTTGDEALGYARRSLSIARKGGTFEETVMALRATASLTLDVDRTEAFRLIDEAADLARQRGDLADDARNRVIKARMAWKVGPHDQAVANSTAALDAIEAERNLQPDSFVRAQRFSAWAPSYGVFAGHLLAGDLEPDGQPTAADIEHGFAIIERMRARGLLDAMDAAQATPVGARGADSDTHTALLARLADVRRRLLDPTLPVADRHQATGEFERLEREAGHAREALAASDPSFGALHAPRLASIDEVERVLAPDQALLVFQIFRDTSTDGTFLGGSWLTVVRRGSRQVYRLTVGQLDGAVELFLGLLERRDGSERAAAARLYRDLLERGLADLPPTITRLVIVPSGALHRLPFDALRPRPDAPPLADRYEIALEPSATTWVRWRTAPRTIAAVPAFVMADPDIVSATSKPGALPRLARARAEGRRVIDEVGGASELRLGQQASEQELKHRELSRFAILHFATHALVDEEHPDRSALLLTPGSPDEDGWLKPREIVGLHLNGQLVVLSACLSASGAIVGGEGIMGLAHGFFHAGAHAVIGGMWPLKDREAAALVDAFYRHLGRGERVGSALALARRERIRAGDPAAAWAGLTLIGDADMSPINEPISRRWFSRFALAAVLTVIAGAIVLIVRRSARTALSS
jgi:tetratricopeptide (TPR) repeat protein